MKSIFIFFFIVSAQIFSAQNIYFTKVEKTTENKDKFFYHISEEVQAAEYLAELEIQGFSSNDSEVFSVIYKKAKEIGANSFSLKSEEGIDGGVTKFDPYHYKLKLYYLPKENFSAQNGDLYLFSGSEKDQKIGVNRKDYKILPRMYLKLNLSSGEIYTISTKKLLGSTIKIQKSIKNENQYFQTTTFKVGGSNQNDGTLHVKSGDITGLERSYAEFLQLIYEEIK